MGKTIHRLALGLTLDEVTARVVVHRETVAVWIQNGELVATKLRRGGKYWIQPAHVGPVPEGQEDELMAMTAEPFIELKDEAVASAEKTVSDQRRALQGWNTWHRRAWTFMPQHNMSEKVFVIERLERGAPEGVIADAQARVGDIE